MDILIVEDDFQNAKLIEKLLKKEGYKVDIAHTYIQASKLTQNTFYPLIILDWNLPDKSGYDLLTELRKLQINSQILMLSANDEVDFRVKALNGGADDYLCKPYSQIELLARVKSILRRSDYQKSTSITLGNIIIDKNSHSVSMDGATIDLTRSEFELFERMASNPNKIFTKSDLLNIICNDYESAAMSNVIEVYISNIRKKLNNKGIIKTIRNVGYKINFTA